VHRPDLGSAERTTTPTSSTSPPHRTKAIIIVVAVSALLFGSIGVAFASTGHDPISTGAETAATTSPTAMPPMDHSADMTAMPDSPGTTDPSADPCPNLTGETVMADGMVMAPIPQRPPTTAERAAADKLVADTRSGTERYQDQANAKADGYRPVTDSKAAVQHWANYDIARHHDTLDPQHPDALIYGNTVKGTKLLGAMFLSPGNCVPGPDPGGPLTQWHAHDNLCMDAAADVTGKVDADKTCTSGRAAPTTRFMLHVWLAPSLGDPLQPEITPAQYVPIIRTGEL
jgi:hypothetical protein